MSWVETKYINLISHRLDRFKEVGRDLYNFRCPYCGDSQKKKSRRRGYFYADGPKMVFKCHNCGEIRGFGEFLKDNCPEQYKPYIFEIFGKPESKSQDNETSPAVFATPNLSERFKNKTPRRPLMSRFSSMAEVDDDNPGLIYLTGRRIPEEFFDSIYWVPDGSVFSDFLPLYEERELPSHPAVAVPFYDRKKSLMYVQLRYIGSDSDIGDLRYMTLEVDGGMKVWGLDRIDWTKPVDILEGAFDAMFMENSVAVAGADIVDTAQYLKDHGVPDVRLIWDADFSRNADVRKRLTRAVEKGFSVVMFEKGSLSGKDINDAIKNDMDRENVRHVVDSRTFDGLSAKLALSQFRKPTEKRTNNVHSSKKKRKADFNF